MSLAVYHSYIQISPVLLKLSVCVCVYSVLYSFITGVFMYSQDAEQFPYNYTPFLHSPHSPLQKFVLHL